MFGPPLRSSATQYFLNGADQIGRQRHGKDLVGNAVDVTEWFNRNMPGLGRCVRADLCIRLIQLIINPADQVATGNVAMDPERIPAVVEGFRPTGGVSTSAFTK